MGSPLTLLEHMGSPLVFGVVRVVLIFIVFLCCDLFCFVSLRAVFCVFNLTDVSGLSILDSTFGFL